jgi:RimJ/RimL family protein N-acetyltransferase
MSIRLSFFKKEHEAGLKKFQLPPEQLEFTAMPIEALAVAIKDTHRNSVVVLREDIPVGFFVLSDGLDIKEYTNNPNAFILRAFSIDYLDQRKGYAKEALRLLPDFVRENFRGKTEIALAVNDRNISARKLYMKQGFVDQGKRKMGRKGEQWILHLFLND